MRSTVSPGYRRADTYRAVGRRDVVYLREVTVRKHIILFLAGNPLGTAELASGREARAIEEELERSEQRDRFEFVSRWAVRPLDLLRELRKLKPTVVHFSVHGKKSGQQSNPGLHPILLAEGTGDAGADDTDDRSGLIFQGANGRPQLVTAAALRETFGAVGTSVKVVVLNTCYSDTHVDALLVHVDCVVSMDSALRDNAARVYTIGFYGGLGARQSVAAAHLQGCAAISLEESRESERPQLRVRDGVNADQLVLAEIDVVDPEIQRAPNLARIPSMTTEFRSAANPADWAETATDKQRKATTKRQRWWIRAAPGVAAAASAAIALLMVHPASPMTDFSIAVEPSATPPVAMEDKQTRDWNKIVEALDRGLTRLAAALKSYPGRR
jgi:hypothetical protein